MLKITLRFYSELDEHGEILDCVIHAYFQKKLFRILWDIVYANYRQYAELSKTIIYLRFYACASLGMLYMFQPKSILLHNKL